MYHSWTAFVLLLWALLMWMVPDKRSSMMKCSPFIVLYTTLLLMGQYVYSMDFNDTELPEVVYLCGGHQCGVNMTQLGFSKAAQVDSRWHLVVKVCCTAESHFWSKSHVQGRVSVPLHVDVLDHDEAVHG